MEKTQAKTQIPYKRFRKVITLLTEKDLIQHNPATNQIKLSQNTKTLLINQKEAQEQPATAEVGTIIIPPQETLMIQYTRTTNLTDTSLELEIRLNKKIREIAISKIK